MNFANIVTHNLKSYANNLGVILELFIDADTESEKSEMLNFLKEISIGFTTTIQHLTEVVEVQNIEVLNLSKLNLYDYVKAAIDNLLVEVKETKETTNPNQRNPISTVNVYSFNTK